MPEYVIKSPTALRRWLRSEAPRHKKWYGAMLVPELVVSTKPEWFFEYKVTETKKERRRYALHPLDLPPVEPADASRQWWDAKSDTHIMLMLRHRDGEYVCLARLGTWEALPEWCAHAPREEWEEMEWEAFWKLVPAESRSEMLQEHEVLGISVRRVPLRSSMAPDDGAQVKKRRRSADREG